MWHSGASSHHACLYSFNIFVIFSANVNTTKSRNESRRNRRKEEQQNAQKLKIVYIWLICLKALTSTSLAVHPPACDLNLLPLVGQVPISQIPGTVSNLCSVTYHYQGATATPLATADGHNPLCLPSCPVNPVKPRKHRKPRKPAAVVRWADSDKANVKLIRCFTYTWTPSAQLRLVQLQREQSASCNPA